MRLPICVIAALSILSASCAGPSPTSNPSKIAPATQKAASRIQVDVTLDQSTMTYTIALNNPTDHSVAFYDDLSDESQYSRIHYLWRAGPARIRVWDSDGKLLTVNEYNPDGWWDPSVFASQGWTLPISMARLAPHEHREFTFTIRSACMGCQALPIPGSDEEFHRSLVGKQIQLRIQIHDDDPFLKTVQTVDTNRLRIK